MNRDIIDINDYTVLVETGQSEVPTTNTCIFDEPVIAIAFYGSGNVDLEVKFGDKQKVFNYTKGLVISFYADSYVEFVHTISALKPLECILVASSISNLDKLPNQEGQLFSEMLDQLVNPSDHYVEGPGFFMTPEMQSIVDQVLRTEYKGKARMMFFRSQITVLLAHFFGQLSMASEKQMSSNEQEKLEQAKNILISNLDNPPSLSDLSQQIGLNTFKLKKSFKALFGVPVFKYLQNERLKTAYHLLSNQEMTVQEAAWHVGYDSISSFSNAFDKKYGFRPSEVKG